MQRLISSVCFSIFVVLTILYCFSSVPKPTAQGTRTETPKTTIEHVLHKLARIDQSINVEIIPSNEINAYAYKDTDGSLQVRVYTGIIDFVDNADEIASVVGHEIGHHLLGHTSEPGSGAIYQVGDYTSSPQHELMADLVGATIAKSAGYDPCQYIYFWLKMRDKYGDGQEGTHPTPTRRIEQLNRSFNCHINTELLYPGALKPLAAS